MTNEATYDTTAYDAIVARMDARRALLVQDELLEELTEESIPGPDDLGGKMRAGLWAVGAVLLVMVIAGLFAHPAAGFAFAGIATLFWLFLIQAGKEISISEDGAGNMYRTQKVGRNPKAREIIEHRHQVVEELVEHEDPHRLLKNLDDPEYVRTLKEALHRDEQGWTMSD